MVVDIMVVNIVVKNNIDIKGGKVVDIIWGKIWIDDIFGNKLLLIVLIIFIGKVRNNSINFVIILFLIVFLVLLVYWYFKKFL